VSRTTAEIAIQEVFSGLEVAKSCTWVSLRVSVRSIVQSVILRRDKIGELTRPRAPTCRSNFLRYPAQAL
jgi:hypothetical protein